MTESWKLTLPCTRAEAEAMNDDHPTLALIEPAPAIISHEPNADRPDQWEIHAYFEGKPDSETVDLVRKLIPSAAHAQLVLEPLPDADWLTLSQSALEPVRVGRFYVYTESYAETIPTATIPLQINAGQAFGTGGHDTTAGCAIVLDALERRGKRFRNIADVGTGTGILAFMAQKLWPAARIVASDIDAVSVNYAQNCADLNRIPMGRGVGQVALVTASGVDHPLIRRRAPYDLLIANILAGPLIELASGIAPIIAPGGSVILAGLLARQRDQVVAAYARHGFRLANSGGSADWPCLHLIKRVRYGYHRTVRSTGRTSQPPGDFGTW